MLILDPVSPLCTTEYDEKRVEMLVREKKKIFGDSANTDFTQMGLCGMENFSLKRSLESISTE